MKDCFLVRTGSFLPGQPVPSDQIQDYLGRLDGEQAVRDRVLKMNGITRRHYALDRQQNPTGSVVSMAANAVQNCMADRSGHHIEPPSFLSAGSTYTPLSGPGFASMLHAELSRSPVDETSEADSTPFAFKSSLEISSQAGICSSGAAALTAAYRSIRCGDHRSAIAVGSEHASHVLKSTRIRPEDDRDRHRENLNRSKWFMSVFLRFMLSDGAGAVMLSDTAVGPVSMRVDWVHSRSYAHDTDLCMKLDNATGLLSQDVGILSRYLLPRTEVFLDDAFNSQNESIDNYDVVLPHLSSFFFRRRMEKIMRGLSRHTSRTIPYWTNLATAGNTGAASIFVMLDEYVRTNQIAPGQRLLLFIPESGQFNFVLVSLTVVSS